jgi:hypothetical protein
MGRRGEEKKIKNSGTHILEGEVEVLQEWRVGEGI